MSALNGPACVLSCSVGGMLGRTLAIAATLCIAAAGVASGVGYASAQATVFMGDGQGGYVPADSDLLLSRARSAGSIPVIVTMRTDFTPEGDLSLFQAANQRLAIASLQSRVLARMSNPQNVKQFESVPMLGLLADSSDMRALISDRNVEAIYEDIAVPPTLDDSVPLIEANKVWNRKGVIGEGWTVAVLDTGVERNHKSLRGKIVSEACYSSTVPGQSTTVCPGGVEVSTIRTSGQNCDDTLFGCFHGTHVSGIAVGNPSNNFKGVAKGANLFPIQVFSAFGAGYPSCGGTACVLSYTSDQILGLERVSKLANKKKVASVNMSIGGGTFSSACDGDARKPIIDTLRSKKVAVAIASGNNGFNGSVNAPGCISSAITVGSTTKQDAISSFSNHANLVDMMAPGSDITSSLLGNTFGSLSGTSMATPHVAGAFALLRSGFPTASVNKIETALKCSGVPVSRSGITKPRINVFAAYKALQNGC
jgi:subtilisin